MKEKKESKPFTVSGWKARGIALTDTFEGNITVGWAVNGGIAERPYSSLEDMNEKMSVESGLHGQPKWVMVDGKRHGLFPTVFGLSPHSRKLIKGWHREEMPKGEGATMLNLSEARELSEYLDNARHEVKWLISEEPHKKDYGKSKPVGLKAEPVLNLSKEGEAIAAKAAKLVFDMLASR